MIPVLVWWIIGGIISLIVGSAFFDFTKKKHCWVIMGDAGSGKSELLCMLQDMERDPKGEKELTHATASTPGNQAVEVEVLNQTITFCDGPGASTQKNSRFHSILNGPVKMAIKKKHELVLIYMIDMEKMEEQRKNLIPEVSKFLKGLAMLIEKDYYNPNEANKFTPPDDVEVDVFVIGTHMDKIEEVMLTSTLQRVIDDQKMKYPLAPFMKNVCFKFVYGDIYSYKGRCEFLKAFGEKLKGME